MFGNSSIDDLSCDESGTRSAYFTCDGCREIVSLKVRKEHFCNLDMQSEKQYEKSVHDCTQNGVVYYTCKNCKNQVEKTVNATEHNKVYRLYNKNGSVFAAWRCLNDFCLESGTEKVKSVDVTTPATCVSYGFANVEFENGTVEKIKLDINYSVHRWHGKYIIMTNQENKVFYDYGTDGIYVIPGGTIATCNENVLGADDAKGYCCCGDCGKKFLVFVRKPHTLVTIEGVAPTETKTGLTEGVKCSVCGKIYIQQEVIPALGSYSNEYSVYDSGSIESFNGVFLNDNCGSKTERYAVFCANFYNCVIKKQKDCKERWFFIVVKFNIRNKKLRLDIKAS